MMTSKEELEKMTVAQIKEKLKNRRLTIGGTKAELITRLHESIVAEERLLDEGPGGENIDLSNVNIDEVLGLDDDKDTQSADSSENIKQNDSSFMTIGGSSILDESSSNAKKSGSLTAAKTQMDNMTYEDNLTANDSLILSDSSKSVSKPEPNGTTNVTDADKKIPMDADKKIQLKTAARLGVPLADVESKTKRDIRFGSGNNDEEMKTKRLARFGQVDDVKQKPATEEDEKMLKRAERFGLPLKRVAAESSSSSSSEDIREKRAKRFGLADNGGNEDTKKAARAKRFGFAT